MKKFIALLMIVTIFVFAMPIKENADDYYTGCNVFLNELINVNIAKSESMELGLINEAIYRTKTGIKYHRYGCRYLHSSCIQISIDEVKNRELESCSRCCP